MNLLQVNVREHGLTPCVTAESPLVLVEELTMRVTLVDRSELSNHQFLAAFHAVCEGLYRR